VGTKRIGETRGRKRKKVAEEGRIVRNREARRGRKGRRAAWSSPSSSAGEGGRESTNEDGDKAQQGTEIATAMKGLLSQKG